MARDVIIVETLSQCNSHIYADCFARPIDHDGKVNSEDTGIHAQQSLNLLPTNNLRVISVSRFHHAQDRRKRVGSINYLLQSSRECIQMQSRHLKCFPVMRCCRRANLLPLAVL